MDAYRKKRRLLAAIEGQLARWEDHGDPATCRDRVMALVKRLQQGTALPDDRDYPRRVAKALAALPGLHGDKTAFTATLTLARVDCLLWQISLSVARRFSASKDSVNVSREYPDAVA